MKGIAFIGTFFLLLASCTKPHVPEPEQTADLYAHFYGEFNGVPIEFTENVVGFYHTATHQAQMELPPNPSSIVYFSRMKSNQVLTALEVGVGSIYWDGSEGSEPTLEAFNTFFNNNKHPDYTENGADGFQVRFTDGTGRIWTSDALSSHPQDVEFSSIHQESDSKGDYSSFTCAFECYVYSLNPDSLALQIDHLDSLHITNAVYHGWFQR